MCQPKTDIEKATTNVIKKCCCKNQRDKNGNETVHPKRDDDGDTEGRKVRRTVRCTQRRNKKKDQHSTRRGRMEVPRQRKQLCVLPGGVT